MLDSARILGGFWEDAAFWEDSGRMLVVGGFWEDSGRMLDSRRILGGCWILGSVGNEWGITG